MKYILETKLSPDGTLPQRRLVFINYRPESNMQHLVNEKSTSTPPLLLLLLPVLLPTRRAPSGAPLLPALLLGVLGLQLGSRAGWQCASLAATFVPYALYHDCCNLRP